MSVTGIGSDWAGRIVDGRFTLLQWLGGTERSGVFLTELTGPQPRKAAIKLIQAEAGDAEATMAGWAATRPFSHPHLMRLFHTGRCEMDGCALIFAVTEFADEILSEILPARALTPTEAREMLEPVLDVLSYLHGKGLVHGHLKPSNVMVVEDRLKLSADCLQAASETGRQRSAQSIYVAPEAATGTVSPAADVWGVGVTLVEALTQHPPVWAQAGNGPAAGGPIVPESIPQPFAAIARGCLRADPMGRCTLGNVKAWLDAGQQVPEPSGGTEKKARAKNRVPVLVFAAIVLVAAFAVVELRSSRTEQPQAVASPQPDVQQAATSVPPSPQPAQDQLPPAAQATPQAQDETSAAQGQQQAPAIAPSPATHSSNGPAANGAVAERVMPDVLPGALASIRGKVDVGIRVTVDAQGNVSKAGFESEGPSRYFSNAALKAAQNWKFKPAQADGQPVTSAWIIKFHFTQAGIEVTPLAAH